MRGEAAGQAGELDLDDVGEVGVAQTVAKMMILVHAVEELGAKVGAEGFEDEGFALAGFPLKKSWCGEDIERQGRALLAASLAGA